MNFAGRLVINAIGLPLARVEFTRFRVQCPAPMGRTNFHSPVMPRCLRRGFLRFVYLYILWLSVHQLGQDDFFLSFAGAGMYVLTGIWTPKKNKPIPMKSIFLLYKTMERLMFYLVTDISLILLTEKTLILLKKKAKCFQMMKWSNLMKKLL